MWEEMGGPRKTRRVGHAGASGVVRGNTLASFDAAVALGVDMIEFDVRAGRGRLMVAHTPVRARRPGCLDLDRALAHLRTPPFAGIEVNVDLKEPGLEAGTLAALRHHGLAGRALLSSQMPAVVDRVRALDPAARTGVSVGGWLARRGNRWGDWRTAILAALRERRYAALMAHHSLVDAALAAQVDEAGAELFAWTVQERTTLDRLAPLGLDGITVTDPRLFA